MTIPQAKAFLALQLLVEGMSIRSVERVTHLHRDTLVKLIRLSGDRCQLLMDARLGDLKSRFIELDELWTFIMKKQPNVGPYDPGEYGDNYCFVALDPDSKLVPTFAVGQSDRPTAIRFVYDLSQRVSGRIQISSDAFFAYFDGIQAGLQGWSDRL